MALGNKFLTAGVTMLVTGAIVMAFSQVDIRAQSSSDPNYRPRQAPVAPMTNSAQYMPDFYYPQGHASTAAEGAARGMADVVRSAGYANLMNSEAARNYEEARSRDLDNRLKGTETYFQNRSVNRAAVAEEAGPQATMDQLFRIAKDNAPSLPSAVQLDRVSGAIRWPIVLRDPEYAQLRDSLDRNFYEWAEQRGQLSLNQYNQIQQDCKEMLSMLRANVKKYNSSLYVEAKKLVEGLAYQVRTSA